MIQNKRFHKGMAQQEVQTKEKILPHGTFTIERTERTELQTKEKILPLRYCVKNQLKGRSPRRIFDKESTE